MVDSPHGIIPLIPRASSADGVSICTVCNAGTYTQPSKIIAASERSLRADSQVMTH